MEKFIEVCTFIAAIVVGVLASLVAIVVVVSAVIWVVLYRWFPAVAAFVLAVLVARHVGALP